MRREKEDSGREDCGKNQGYQRVANVVFLCCQFGGDNQIGDNGKGRERVGWMERGVFVMVVVVTEEWQRGGGQREQLVIGACSQLARFEVRGFKTKKQRGRGGTEKEEREKGSKKTRSVYTKKCSASDSRTG